MKKIMIIAITLSISILVVSVLGSEKELPLSDKIELLNITPYGDETKQMFEVSTGSTYLEFYNEILGRIRNGFRTDCNCDLDNEYFIQLENREAPPGSWPGIRLSSVPMYCSVVFSKNKKFAGLIFSAGVMEGTMHHFVMVNSKGEVIWERKPVEKKRSSSKVSEPDFPNDEGDVSARYWYVSNDGKLLMITATGWCDDAANIYSHELGMKMQKGWTLFGSDGIIIAKQNYWSREAAFSDDGSYFVIQEMRNPNAKTYNLNAGTTCYDSRGKQLWRKENILPIDWFGYSISPSGNYIIAYFKTENELYDQAIYHKNGELLVKSNKPYKKRIKRKNQYDWTPSERMFCAGNVVFDINYKPIADFEEINMDLKEEYSHLPIRAILPLNDEYLIAFGHRGSDLKRTFKPGASYKWIGIYDQKMKLLGIKFVTTIGFDDREFRIILDKKSDKIFFLTGDTMIEAMIRL